MSETKFVEQDNLKPVPNDPDVIPALDADRRTNTNLAPQGEMHPDARPESKFTPEGDQEPAANIPPSATDPE